MTLKLPSEIQTTVIIKYRIDQKYFDIVIKKTCEFNFGGITYLPKLGHMP